jgi:putative tryptophan/tyrosine transport system substrate-binding protein
MHIARLFTVPRCASCSAASIRALGVKRVGLLRELVPSASVFAVVANPNNPYSAPDVKEIEKSIQAAGLKAVVLYAGDASEFDAAFNKLKQEQANALVVSTDGFFTSHRQELIALAARFSARISGH